MFARAHAVVNSCPYTLRPGFVFTPGQTRMTILHRLHCVYDNYIVIKKFSTLTHLNVISQLIN